MVVSENEVYQIIKKSCLGIVGLRYKPMLNGVIFNLLKKCLILINIYP